jgi:hypothetical protein
VRHEKALKGQFSYGTAVSIIAFFMEPTPIEDPTFIGEARLFLKTLYIVHEAIENLQEII